MRKSQVQCDGIVDGSLVENGYGNETKSTLRVESLPMDVMPFL